MVTMDTRHSPTTTFTTLTLHPIPYASGSAPIPSLLNLKSSSIPHLGDRKETGSTPHLAYFPRLLLHFSATCSLHHKPSCPGISPLSYVNNKSKGRRHHKPLFCLLNLPPLRQDFTQAVRQGHSANKHLSWRQMPIYSCLLHKHRWKVKSLHKQLERHCYFLKSVP